MRRTFRKLLFLCTRLTAPYEFTFDTSRLSIPIAGVLQRNPRGCTSFVRNEANCLSLQVKFRNRHVGVHKYQSSEIVAQGAPFRALISAPGEPSCASLPVSCSLVFGSLCRQFIRQLVGFPQPIRNRRFHLVA